MMPGGLTQIGSSESDFVVSINAGGCSQDTWILADDKRPTVEAVRAEDEKIQIKRQTSQLSSTAADNIFWFGRYLERTDHALRVIRMLNDNLLQEGVNLSADSVAPFLHLLLPKESLKVLLPTETEEPLFPPKPKKLDLEAIEFALQKQLWDTSVSNALVSTLENIHRTAFIIKERLSVDSWNLLTKIRDIQLEAGRNFKENGKVSSQVLSELIVALSGINGTIADNMTRAHDWNFLDIGRRIERGMNIAELVSAILCRANVDTRTVLMHLLAAADSSYTYRGRYLNNIQVYPVLDLLVNDESNPRAIVFQIIRLQEVIKQLPQVGNEQPQLNLEKLLLHCYSRIRLSDYPAMSTLNSRGERRRLVALLTKIIQDLSNISIVLGQIYFAHGRTGNLIKL